VLSRRKLKAIARSSNSFWKIIMNPDVVVLGAGPYGLGAGAHLRQIKGLGVRIFGEPMSFWKNQMPAGMLLRSSWEASHLWDPEREFTLNGYQKASGNRVPAPVSLDRFVDYGLWFQQKAVPDLDCRRIETVEKDPSGFRVTIENGEVIKSRRVIVAAGIFPFAWRPAEFDGLPSSIVSHTSEHRDLAQFRGKRVIVVGGGQSALESAALLHEAGADVEIIIRVPQVKWLGWKKRIQSLGPVSKLFYSWTDVGPAGISRIVSLPGLLQQFPRSVQDRLRTRSVRPAGAYWLLARLKNVARTTGQSISSASEVGGQIRLRLSDGSERMADHVLLGTGYRVDVAKYGFLAPNILEELRRMGGYPQLGPGFESSVPGLHFLGAPAAWSYGPLMNFVSGTRYAGNTLAEHITKDEGEA
jgi:cation diffusion facilitator CzcD-associated flavoprotein CzcO